MIDYSENKNLEPQKVRTLRILLVDDDEDEYVLIWSLLKGRIYRWDANFEVKFQLDWTPSYEEAIKNFQENLYDAYLIDHYLETRTGIELLEEASKTVLTAPIIILTGRDNYAIDVAAARAGAADYLIKGQINESLLERSLRYAIERKQAEEKLKRAHQVTASLTQELFRANQRSKTILRTLPAGVIITDADGHIVNTNDMLDKIIGNETPFPPDTTIYSQYKGWRADNGEMIKDEEWALARALSKGEISVGEVIDIERFDGKKATILNSAAPIYDENNTIAGAVGVILDISHQRELERQVKAAALEAQEFARVVQEERNRLFKVIVHAPSAFVVTDKNGKIVIANPTAETLFGSLASGELLENLIAECSELPDGSSGTMENFPLSKTLHNGETHINFEFNIKNPDGQRLFLLVNSSPIQDRDGYISGAVAIFQDITSRKQEEEETRRHATRIEVQQHLIEYQELERLRIAQDLHDGPLQELIAIHLALDEIHHQGTMAVKNNQYSEINEILQGIQDIKSALKKQIYELRSFNSELRPPLVTALGLESAIRSHLRKIQEKDPQKQIEMELDRDHQRLPDKTTLAFFRIFQELLNNISKHAEATQVWISLKFSDDQVTLKVKDNGKGISVPLNWINLARKGHLGLVGVQERAKSVGGEVKIKSSPGMGTEIEVWAPLKTDGDQNLRSYLSSNPTNG